MQKRMRFLWISTTILICALLVVTAVTPAALAQGRGDGWAPPPARGDPSAELQAQIDELAQRLSVLEAGSQPDTVIDAGSQPDSITVNCLRGETVAGALAQVADTTDVVTIIVLGICNENVTIRRDNLMLQGARGGGVRGPDPARATIFIDAARRVGIHNLSISGGSDGVVGNRGAIFDLLDCTVQSARFGIVANNGGTAVVDNCDIGNNGENGVVAANSAQVYLTNSSVHDNGDSGVVAVRNAHIRVGQDLFASVLGPVTIRDNGGSGLVVTENSAGILVSSTVQNNGGTGVFIGRGSNAQVGVGSLGAVGPNTIRNNSGNGVSVFQSSQAQIHGNLIQTHPSAGVFVEGSAATITTNTIRGSGSYGVLVTGSGDARIGVTDSGTAAGNLIEQSTLDGILLARSSAAVLYGNTIRNNGAPTNRWGILAVQESIIRMVGLNTVQFNGGAGGGGGVFLRSSTLQTGQGDFSLTPNTNDISNNSGDGIHAQENTTINLRDGTTISNNDGAGISLLHGARLQAQETTVSANMGDGIRIVFGSSARLFGPPNFVVNTVSGNTGFGLFCTDNESSAVGDFSAISGNTAGQVSCTGF